jgi:hypothetical protein
MNYSQVLWMRRLRVLRRLLVKYRAAGKIDKHLYHELYHLSKGNTFKHKRALVEHVRNFFPSPLIMSITSRVIHPISSCLHRICLRLDVANQIPTRSTKPKPKNNANASSRKKWTPSVPRQRLPANDDRSASHRSGTRWLGRMRSPRRSRVAAWWQTRSGIGGWVNDGRGSDTAWWMDVSMTVALTYSRAFVVQLWSDTVALR